MRPLMAIAAFCIAVVPSIAQADWGWWHRPNHWQRHRYENHWDHKKRWGWSGRNNLWSTENLIDRGIRNGDLSRREVRGIREEQRELREAAQRYRADGYISRREREKLRDRYEDLRKDLHHELRDGEHRW